jgi:hypothetical protein
MAKHRTQLISTPAGLQATLNTTSVHRCQESLEAACDQYLQRYHDLPHTVMLADRLAPMYKWQLRKWLESKQIVWAAHYYAADLLLIQPPVKAEVS